MEAKESLGELKKLPLWLEEALEGSHWALACVSDVGERLPATSQLQVLRAGPWNQTLALGVRACKFLLFELDREGISTLGTHCGLDVCVFPNSHVEMNPYRNISLWSLKLESFANKHFVNISWVMILCLPNYDYQHTWTIVLTTQGTAAMCSKDWWPTWFFSFLIMCVDMSMCGYVHLSSGSHGSQRPWICVELEF